MNIEEVVEIEKFVGKLEELIVMIGGGERKMFSG